MTRRSRAAFSIFDLVVAIAILGILIGLLLPAIQKVRTAAVGSKSRNNLKELGLAVHNYNDSFGQLPPGNDKNGFSVAARLLPFIEQDALYRKIKFDKPTTDKENAEIRQMVVKVFLSPDDTQPALTPGATNYLFNAGSNPSLADNDGVFYLDSKITFPKITDGTSNTLMIGETLKGDGKKKAETVARQHVLLGKDALKGLKADAGVQDFKEGKNLAADRCGSWMDGAFLQGTFTGTLRANDERPDVSCAGAGGVSALRTLGDRVNVAFCDGSARVLKTNLDPTLWKPLTSRNGGETFQLKE